MPEETLQPLDKPTLTRPGLLVMDVDSTLIDEEVIDLLGEAAGVGDRVARITARAMAGELDFAEALRARVALLQGLPASVFARTRAAVHFTTGALELIDALHGHGWTVGVVSGGFHEVVDDLVADAGIDHALANRLEVVDGVLTGRIVGPIVTRDLKRQSLVTVALGDGANDIPMILTAGLGVAFCAKPAVRAAAPHAIDERDLTRVLELLR